jgi:prepilin-type N-terminal cleavage/methylation domain-containing protein
LGAEFNKLSKAEQAAVAAYVRAEYDKLVFQEPNSYVSRNAQADPEDWLERLRELIASDRERVRAIVEQARSQTKNNRGGFTLIELSIVLVIIGLIVGAILVGQSLIHQAQLQRIMKEQTQFAEAINTFYGKYNCIPGDCPNATNFFGSAGGTGSDSDVNCTTPAATNMGSTGTCNGNGDGKIGDNGTLSVVDANGVETYLVWQHLALAGLIPGSYSIKGQCASNGRAPGYNAPASNAVAGGEWEILRVDNTSTASTVALTGGSTTGVAPNIEGQHALVIGNYLYCNQAQTPFLSVADAFAFDTKYDDGMPFTGFISAEPEAGGGYWCMAGAATATTQYNTANAYDGSQNPCMLLFQIQLP